MTSNPIRHATIFPATAVLWLAAAATAPAAGPSPKEQLMQQYPPRLTASAPESWKPVRCQVVIPDRGVTLAPEGLFRPAMEQSIVHLLETMSVDEMLYSFRLRAGVKNPPAERNPYEHFGMWCKDLKGSDAARFLMGAGNTLKWMEHPELRQRLNLLIDGIAACQRADGYLYAFAPEEYNTGEHGAYARNWFTVGMLDAGAAGNPKAYGLIRKGHDWFNHWDKLPDMLYLSLGLQGHTSCTRMYFSPVGKPEDLQVAEKYYVQDWWLDRLIARDLDAIWNYPLNRPHCYEITGFEAYLDHYLATGEKKLLDGMTAAWELIKDHWLYPGGASALGEFGKYPPDSYRLPGPGETCGSVFWVWFNQRFHRLFPDEEKYTAEIEEAIYNVGLANLRPEGIRYHTFLDIGKDIPNQINSCCELMGSRLYGSLPEYIYSIAADGLYVNLFEPSAIEWKRGAETVRLTQETRFPFAPEARLRLSTAAPTRFNLRVRMPRWAAGPVQLTVNGKPAAVGKPGSYVSLDRKWMDGDTVAFALPMTPRLVKYTGVQQLPGGDRHAMMLGPLLMALVGPVERFDPFAHGVRVLATSPDDLLARLRPVADKPLTFTVAGNPGIEYRPYWQVHHTTFSCFPVLHPHTIRAGERFFERPTVEVVKAADDVQVCYTLDGSEPCRYSPALEGTGLQYLNGRSGDCLLKTRAYRGDTPLAPTMRHVFTQAKDGYLQPPQVRTTRDGQTIEILPPAQYGDVTLHYAMGAADPKANWQRYLSPLPLPATGTVLRAKAVRAWGREESAETTFQVADPITARYPRPDVWLDKLEFTEPVKRWKGAQRGKSCEGNLPLRLAGTTHDRGLGTAAGTELLLDARPDYRRFVVLVGINEAAEGRGAAVIEIQADDRCIYRVPFLEGGAVQFIDAPIPAGTKTLRLVTREAGLGLHGDWIDWVNAGFMTATAMR